MANSGFSIHKEDQTSQPAGSSSQQEGHQPDPPSQTVQEDGAKGQPDHVQGKSELRISQEKVQKDGKAGKTNPKKKRGKDRGTITLGGLHRIEKSKKRKEKQRMRRKIGEIQQRVPEGWKKMVKKKK